MNYTVSIKKGHDSAHTRTTLDEAFLSALCESRSRRNGTEQAEFALFLAVAEHPQILKSLKTSYKMEVLQQHGYSVTTKSCMLERYRNAEFSDLVRMLPRLN